MPTTHPIKNLEYVKKSQMKKQETQGAEAYNKINADAEHKVSHKHRDKLKATIGKDELKTNKPKI
jgi:hypothetical protein